MSKFEFLPGIGFVEVEDTGKVKKTNIAKTSDTGIASEISRKIGLDGQIKKNAKIIEALSKPEEYLTKRNEALLALQEELDGMYATELFRLIKNGVSNEKAEQLATRGVEARRDVRLKEIEIDFPTEVEKLIVDKLRKKNQVK
jgi:hypothetical protein